MEGRHVGKEKNSKTFCRGWTWKFKVLLVIMGAWSLVIRSLWWRGRGRLDKILTWFSSHTCPWRQFERSSLKTVLPLMMISNERSLPFPKPTPDTKGWSTVSHYLKSNFVKNKWMSRLTRYSINLDVFDAMRDSRWKSPI